jgi:hypothetical protein
MNDPWKILYLISSLLVSAVALAGVDEIPTGNWMGSIEKHKDIERSVKFKVKASDEKQYRITMFLEERPYAFSDLETDARKMTFKLDTGSTYSCLLERTLSGNFSGNCILEIEDETRTIKLIMVAPDVDPQQTEEETEEDSTDPEG